MKTIMIKSWAITKIYEGLLPYLLGNNSYPQELNRRYIRLDRSLKILDNQNDG